MKNLFAAPISYLRLVLILAITPISAFICACIMPFLPYKANGYIIKTWAGIMLFIIGAKLEVTGKPDYLTYFPSNTMVAANHLSWLDILVLYRLYFINFIGKTEMQKWPLLSTMIKAGGTIFINRSRKKDLLAINKAVSQYLLDGHCIGLFPEGGIGEGIKLLPFKSGVLEAAILAKSVIIPVVIIYKRKDNSIANETTFVNKHTLMQSVMSSLQLNGFIAKVIVLERVDAANFTSRDQLTEHLFTQINTKFTHERF